LTTALDYPSDASEDWMKELRDLQSREHSTRRALAEAVADDLGHRKKPPVRRFKRDAAASTESE
jgi:hypothetical protein